MSIVIGRVENKFGNNSGHKFPNSFPVYSERKELKDYSPNMNDFLSGTIYLDGDHGNHCIYRGNYYSLILFQAIDEERKRYCYRLERDLWFDVLSARPKVVGDLANSNNDELLEKNLNRTIAVLDNPARVITINFGEVDFDWKKHFTFKESKKELSQVVLSKDSIDRFVRSGNSHFAKKWKRINQYFYGGNKNPSVFILSYLSGEKITRGGKHLLREKINEFVRGINTDAGDQLKIAKIAGTGLGNTKLAGNYCITHKVDGISPDSENVRLKEIDLSGLSDIIPLNHKDLTELDPYTPLNEGTKSGIFEVTDSKSAEYPFLAKIQRRAYLPICAETPTPYVDSPFGFNNNNYNWTRVKNPQQVKWSWAGKKGDLYLWGIDNINFIINFNEYFVGEKPPGAWIADMVAYTPVAPTMPLSGAFNFMVKLHQLQAISHNVSDFTRERIADTYYWTEAGFSLPIPGSSRELPFRHMDKNYVSFGFILFGLERRFSDGRLFEYINTVKRKSVNYFSGVRASLFRTYRQSEKWWSNIKPELEQITSTPELTRLYLDNFYFSWLAFFPSTLFGPKWTGSPYLNTDKGGTGKHTGNNYYVSDALNTDIRDAEGKWAALNPFNDERYPGHRTNVDQKLAKLLHLSEYELPKGLLLEEGDYLFHDLEYSINKLVPYSEAENSGLDKLADLHDTSLASTGGVGARYSNNFFALQDFVELEGAEPFATEPGEKMVVLCTTFDGKIEVRTLETFKGRLDLLQSDDQIVENVEGKTEHISTFTLIKKLPSIETEEVREEFGDKEKETAIEAFYRVHGYKTKRVGGVAHWNWFDESDFAPASNKQLLFDLVGTDGYAFVAKGKISLIAKNINLFTIQSGKTNVLLHSENKDLNLSLIEKINQRVRFQFLNAPYYVKWKTSFTDADKISLSFETLEPNQLKTEQDQYFIRLDTEFDTIYYENVTVPKKLDQAISIGDSVQIQQLYLNAAKNQYGYQIDQDRLAIATDRYKEAIRRAEVELYNRRVDSGTSFGFGIGSTSLGTGLALRSAKRGAEVKTIKKKFKSIKETEYDDWGRPLGDVYRAYPETTQTIRHRKSKIPNIATMVVGFGLKTLQNSIMEHALRQPEMKRQINFEKQVGAAELALQSLAINTGYIERQLDNQLAINQMTNVYNNPTINDRVLLESFMSKSEWHGGKVLKPAFLTVFVPSYEQLVALKSFKEEYGVMCDIPDVEMRLYDGMPPDVIRFRNLDDEGIKGIYNDTILNFLKSHLLAGIKIVKTTEKVFKLLTVDDLKDKIFRINNDLLEAKQTIDVKDKQLISLNAKIETVSDTVRKECEKEQSELQKQIQEIENQLNNVNAQLRQKIKELEEMQNACEGEKKAKDEEIKKHKVDVEELTQKLNDARKRAIIEQEEINKHKKEKEELQKQLEAEKSKALPDSPVTPDNKVRLDCKTFLTIVKDVYGIDLKIRDNGWNALRDLAFDIAGRLNYLRSSGLDQRLISVTQIAKIIEQLEVLEDIDLISKAMDLLKDNGGTKYAHGLEGQEGESEDSKRITPLVDDLSKLETPQTAKIIKNVLDELNFLTFVAKRDLHDRIEEGSDIELFLRHVYPGSGKDLYKALYDTDPSTSILRRRFATEIGCSSAPSLDPGKFQQIVDDIKKTSDYQNIFVDPKPGTPIIPQDRVHNSKAYTDLVAEKAKLLEELNKCKADRAKAPAGAIVLGSDIINQLFPTSDKQRFRNVPKIKVNVIPSTYTGNFSGAYYRLVYMSVAYRGATPTETYSGVYKPVTKISHSESFAQNLMNCIWDYMWQSTGRFLESPDAPCALNGDYRYIASAAVPFTSFPKPYIDYRTSAIVSLIEFVQNPGDKQLAKMVANAIHRTGYLMAGVLEGSYVRHAGKRDPERTSDLGLDLLNKGRGSYSRSAFAPIHFNNYFDVHTGAKYLIYVLRNNTWNDAYRLIRESVADWDWLDPAKYPA